jgi:outer membrane protein assembly factor BamB
MLARITISSLRLRATLWAALAIGLLAPRPLAAQSRPEQLPQELDLARAGLLRQWFTMVSLDPLRDRIGTLTLNDGNLYIQTTGGSVQALDGESGRRRWLAQVGGANPDIIPLTANAQSLFVMNATDLFVLDKQSGKQSWQATLQQTPSAPGTATDTELFVPMFDGRLDTYDLKNQRRSWYYATGSRLLSHPIVALGNVAFASNNGNLYVTHHNERRLVFRYETDAPISAPLVKLGEEWIVLASEDYNVYCVHAANGRTRWRFSAEAPILNAPIVLGDKVYILPEGRGMFQIDAETGAEQWRNPQTTRLVAASPTRLYGTDRLGNLVVLDRETGSLEGAVDTSRFELATINTENDRVYLASRTGLVIALREFELTDPVPILPREPEAASPEANGKPDLALPN